MKQSSMTLAWNRTKWMKFSALAAAIMGLFGLVYSTSWASELSTQNVSSELSAFFEAFLDRPLYDIERRKVTQEYIAYYGGGACKDGCVTYLEQLKQLVPKVRANPDNAENRNLLARHVITSPCYFDPKLQDSL
ncbi:MAG: hypothetical protein ABW096_16230 [Candidatus Thiodiazotropha sp.]